MANRIGQRYCFLSIPSSPDYQKAANVIVDAASQAGFKFSSSREYAHLPEPIRDRVIGEVARADCVVADLSGREPNVFFEVGLAQAMGKTLFLLAQNDATFTVPNELRSFQFISYDYSQRGLDELSDRLIDALKKYRRSPKRATALSAQQFAAPFIIDWDRINQADAENLCLELLAQLGFRKIDWYKGSVEIDLIAELPRSDPDGFDYKEAWLVTLGRVMPPEHIIDMAVNDPDYFLMRISRGESRFEKWLPTVGETRPITLLAILLNGSMADEQLEMAKRRLERHSSKRVYPNAIRVRIWDRSYLTSLVQQFPNIGYKYFSDEARAASKYRKTPEELYHENVDLTDRQTRLITALEEEKNKRVRAERDAVWKDISFSAAHKVGNPIFAIETNLDPLQRRILEARTDEAVEVVADIRASVEKAKSIVDQFKSLTRAQEIRPVPTPLCAILEGSCKIAQNQGIDYKVECDSEVIVQGDPERLAECFDELVINSVHWLDKAEKSITVKVAIPSTGTLPEALDSQKRYASIHFQDNGVGIPLELKDKIFDAFFTTHTHGTGLGLALIRRIIEGHGGLIFEVGLPGQGADFEIYLPLVTKPQQEDTAGPNERQPRQNKEKT